MNISILQPPPHTQVSWNTAKAKEKEADFLALRLLNKRTRLRISPQPLELGVLDGQGNYFVVSSLKGWFMAIARGAQGEHNLVLSPLEELRVAAVSATVEGEEEFQPKRSQQLQSAPTHLALGLNDERLVVGFADGSISIFDTSALFSLVQGNVGALQTFPPSGPGPLRQILGNPGDLPDLVAVRREAEGTGDGLVVEILDVKQLQSVGGWRRGGSPETVPTSIVWSPKGKQLAIGVRNGDINTYSPSDVNNMKQHIPKPPQVGESSIINIMWLSNHTFYGIYTQPGLTNPEIPQKHVLILNDIKSNSATQIEFETPYYASPALRPPGAFPVIMRNWDPAKVLIFIGDSTSSDIGVVGSLSEEGSSAEIWYNLSLEETSTPSVPLDKNDNDTVPLALELDSTFTKSGDHNYPPPPVLYLYASDGTLQAWYVSNDKGGSYSGMTMVSTAASAAKPQQFMPAAAGHAQASPTETSAISTTTAFGQTSTPAPAFGSSGLALKSGFGQSSTQTFGTSGFGSFGQNTTAQADPSKQAFQQPSSSGFVSTAFNQPSSAPAFGRPSPFGQTPPKSPAFAIQTSAFGQNATPTSGFGAFASQGASKFGTTGFGFGSPTPPAASPAPVVKDGTPPTDTASPEAEMSEADNGNNDGFGGLSLGSTKENKATGNVTNSMFGSFGPPVPVTTPGFGSATGAFGGDLGAAGQPTNSFGAFGNSQGSGFVKPATGFGAFSNASKPSHPQPTPSTSSTETPKVSSAFGASGFGTTAPQPAFGQPTFGQSTFGSTSFGKQAFGASTPSASTPNMMGAFSAFSGPSGAKGFGAFAQSGPTGFGQGLQPKPSEAPSISMSTSSDGEKSSSFTETTNKLPSPFGGAQNQPGVRGTFSDATQQGTGAFGEAAKPASSPFGSSAQTTNAFGTGQFPSAFGSRAQSTSSGLAPGTPMSTAQSARNGSPDSSPGGSPGGSPRGSPGGSPGGSSTPAEKLSLGKANLLTQDSPSDESKTLGSSTSVLAQPTTPSGTPSPTPFKSTTPVVTSGAFGNLSSTPSAFKPAEGFGAFAAVKIPSTSPFSKPKPATATSGSPVSAFGFGGKGSAFDSATPAKTGTSTPAFGSPSTIGGSPAFGKSSFGAPVTFASSTTPPTKPITSAFGAYGGSGGFNAFTGVSKPSSFSDLLKSQKDDNAQKVSSSAFSSAAISSKGQTSVTKTEEKGVRVQDARDDKEGDVESVIQASAAPKDEILSVHVPRPEELDHDNLPPTPSSHGTFDDEEQVEGERDNDHDDEESFLSESFEGSDYVPEDDKNGEDEDEESDGESEDGEDHSAPSINRRSANVSPPSDPGLRDTTPRAGYSKTIAIPPETPPKSPSIGVGKPVKVDGKTPFETPVNLSTPVPSTSNSTSSPTDNKPLAKNPSPLTSSPSPLPTKSVPSVLGKHKATDDNPAQSLGKSSPFGKPFSFGDSSGAFGNTPSPSLFGNAPSSVGTKPSTQSPSPVSGGAAQGTIIAPSPFSLPGTSLPSTLETTTPPGSPEKNEDVANSKPLAISTGSSASLGLGRPSSRPPRSSPLANTHVSDDEEISSAANQLSQPAPTGTKPRLASPRKPFGQLPDIAVKTEPTTPNISKDESRPQSTTSRTPPLFVGLTSTPLKPPQMSGFSSATATPLPFAVPSIPGRVPPAPSAAGNAPFIMPQITPLSAPPMSRPSFGSSPNTGSLPRGNLFEPKPNQQHQIGVGPSHQQPQLQTTFESGMQAECQVLFLTLSKELDDLQKLGHEAALLRMRIGRSSDTAHTKADLGDKTKWTFGDLDAFGKMLKSIEKDLLVVYEFKEEISPAMREIESNLLKAETRKEEIVRFSKAKADPDFSKMLKARTLGPDAAETQNQLRKQIRLINDRVEQLEVHLKACKKKLDEQRKGKPAMKPPSLDTINRTYRNIDLAIESQTEQIASLTARIAKLNVDALDAVLHGSPSRPRSRHPTDESFGSSTTDSSFRREVTPSVAASTAAALNAERSALRLKNALARTRKTPLLNTQAVESAVRAPTLDSLRRATPSAPLFPDSAFSGMSPDISFDSLPDSGPSTDTQRQTYGRTTRQASHQKSVPLGKTHRKVPSAIVSFDWGPLPGAKPMSSLPVDVRPEVTGRKSS